MLTLLKKLFHRDYQYLNTIELSRQNLLSNYHYLNTLNPKLKIAPVLKSNAYGHGLVETAQILDRCKAPFFCVDSLHEAYRLQKAGIKTPILIMGYINPANLKIKKLPFSYAIYNLEVAEVLNKYQPEAAVHIKVDTGMHRLGVPLTELEQFITQVQQLPNLNIEGFMSHFASAKSIQDPLFKKQAQNYKKALQIVKKSGLNPKWRHISATEALLNPNTRQVISQFTNLARAGKSLYGYAVHTKDVHLQPVLTLKTHIAQIKTLQPGNTVGYDGAFTAKKRMTIAILPIGYNDGVDRRLSNRGMMKVNGIGCPIIGKVSMNITTIDISQVLNPMINQEVVVTDNISAWAVICDTITHEILIHLDANIKRIIV